jgi:hypothetical protein
MWNKILILCLMSSMSGYPFASNSSVSKPAKPTKREETPAQKHARIMADLKFKQKQAELEAQSRDEDYTNKARRMLQEDLRQDEAAQEARVKAHLQAKKKTKQPVASGNPANPKPWLGELPQGSAPSAFTPTQPRRRIKIKRPSPIVVPTNASTAAAP